MNLKAYDNKNKKWLDSFMITPNGMVVIRKEQWGWMNFNDVIVDATLCRGTGLKDKNGVEIFENDIVKFYYNGEEKDSNLSIGMIRYSKRRASFMIKIDDNISSILLCDNIPTSICITDPETNIEIIGNIFDTPHLLEKN